MPTLAPVGIPTEAATHSENSYRMVRGPWRVRYLQGTTDDFGTVSLYDDQGNYYHGTTDDFGSVQMYDDQGNYYDGQINGQTLYIYGDTQENN